MIGVKGIQVAWDQHFWEKIYPALLPERKLKMLQDLKTHPLSLNELENAFFNSKGYTLDGLNRLVQTNTILGNDFTWITTIYENILEPYCQLKFDGELTKEAIHLVLSVIRDANITQEQKLQLLNHFWNKHVISDSLKQSIPDKKALFLDIMIEPYNRDIKLKYYILVLLFFTDNAVAREHYLHCTYPEESLFEQVILPVLSVKNLEILKHIEREKLWEMFLNAQQKDCDPALLTYLLDKYKNEDKSDISNFVTIWKLLSDDWQPTNTKQYKACSYFVYLLYIHAPDITTRMQAQFPEYGQQVLEEVAQVVSFERLELASSQKTPLTVSLKLQKLKINNNEQKEKEYLCDLLDYGRLEELDRHPLYLELVKKYFFELTLTKERFSYFKDFFDLALPHAEIAKHEFKKALESSKAARGLEEFKTYIDSKLKDIFDNAKSSSPESLKRQLSALITQIYPYLLESTELNQYFFVSLATFCKNYQLAPYILNLNQAINHFFLDSRSAWQFANLISKIPDTLTDPRVHRLLGQLIAIKEGLLASHLTWILAHCPSIQNTLANTLSYQRYFLNETIDLAYEPMLDPNSGFSRLFQKLRLSDQVTELRKVNQEGLVADAKPAPYIIQACVVKTDLQETLELRL